MDAGISCTPASGKDTPRNNRDIPIDFLASAMSSACISPRNRTVHFAPPTPPHRARRPMTTEEKRDQFVDDPCVLNFGPYHAVCAGCRKPIRLGKWEANQYYRTPFEKHKMRCAGLVRFKTRPSQVSPLPPALGASR